MITLHHLEYSQSFRVLWLLEELGVEYDLKKYDRDPETYLAPADYKLSSPTGAAPYIDHEGISLGETNAILDYVMDVHPDERFQPVPGSGDRARHLFWYHAAQGSLMPVMLMDSIFRIIVERVPFIIRPLIRKVLDTARDGFIRPRSDALLKMAEVQLSQAPWFGGENLTLADIALSYPMESAQMHGYLTQEHPECLAWLKRIYERPAFKSAKEIDGRPSMVLPLKTAYQSEASFYPRSGAWNYCIDDCSRNVAIRAFVWRR